MERACRSFFTRCRIRDVHEMIRGCVIDRSWIDQTCEKNNDLETWTW